MRIAFLKSGGKQSVVQKLKIYKNNKGQYAYQGKVKEWFNTMSTLIDDSKNENSKRLKRSFLGSKSPPASPTDKDEGDGEYVLGDEDPIPPKTKPAPAPRNIKEEKPRAVTPTDPAKKDYEDEDDVLPQVEKIASNSTKINDLIGDKAPTDVNILYNRQNVKTLLKNHEVGDFIIHQGNKNTAENPYTVYANKENRDGAIKLAPAYIHYDAESEKFSVGPNGKPYSKLRDLLKANKRTLVCHVDL